MRIITRYIIFAGVCIRYRVSEVLVVIITVFFFLSCRICISLPANLTDRTYNTDSNRSEKIWMVETNDCF